MTRYRITVDDHVYDVEIEDPRARPITAHVAGVTYAVEVGPAGDATAGDPDPDPRPARSETPPPTPEREPDATTGATGATGTLAPPPEPPPAPEPDAAAMTAPIPGVVSTVTATVGQTVDRGDELLVIEAMKMFNAMRSPRRGRVALIHVKEGDRVVQGQPLVSFAP